MPRWSACPAEFELVRSSWAAQVEALGGFAAKLGIGGMSSASMAYDQTTDQMILFGGYADDARSTAAGPLDNTWTYGLLNGI